MAHANPDFETKDVLGKTFQQVGTVTTSPLLLPVVPTTQISEVLIRNPGNNNPNDVLLYDFTGQGNFSRLTRGEFVGWSVKTSPGGSSITQITIKSLLGTINYEVIVNVEP
jgi:hypothetical protein